MKNLCLDRFCDWRADFLQYLNSDDCIDVVGNLLEWPEDEAISFIDEIYVDGSGNCAEVNRLLELWRPFFKEKYFSVTAYHGTRVNEEESFLQYGILRSDTEKIMQLARQFVGDDEAFSAAVADIGRDYLSHNSGRVGLLFSSRFAKGIKSSHPDGSELVRGILNRTCGLREWRSKGRAVLIEVELNTSVLEGTGHNSVVDSYVRMSFKEGLLQALLKRTEFYHLSGGFMFGGDVPPNCLRSFIDFELFLRR